MWLMNSATDTASGTAIAIAIVEATMVPKARGQMYLTSPSPPGICVPGAVIAGQAFTIRNSATPASVARMITPAPVASPVKNRSPRRPGWKSGRGSGLWMLAALTKASPGGGLGLARGDRVDGRLQRRPQLVADRGRAGVLGRGVLTLGVDDVARERLDDRALGRVVVLRARHQVRDEDDRIDVRRGRRAVQRVREH